MKKILKILGGLIVLLVLAVILLPFMFKGKVLDMVLGEANKQLNAKVELADLNLSLFENFPDFTITIEGIKVDGKDDFEGITLADIGEIKASVDLSSVISGDQVKINTVGISNPNIHVIVKKNGKANWDIMKPSDTPPAKEEKEEKKEETSSEESAPFSLQIKEYYIRNANVIYDDRQGNMKADLVNFTHEGKGDFTMDNFLFETRTTADEISYIMDGVAMAKKIKTDITFNFQMDLPNKKYEFKENEINLNDLSLSFDGWVQEIENGYDMDLKFGTKQTSFKSLLSLIPNAYTKDFSNVKTNGSLALNGEAKGAYTQVDSTMLTPGFNVNLVVKDASFQYPDLPKSASDINIDVHAKSKGGDLDNVLVDVNEFHLELGENPIDMTFHLSHPMSDPNMGGNVKAQIDLETLADVLPSEDGEKYQGRITSNISFKGKLSSIEKEQYEDFQAQGELIILDMLYESGALNFPVNLRKMYMDFSPKYVELSKFEALVGKSDFAANGRIDNMLAYYFKNDPLTGTFNLTSNLIDVNELMGPETASSDSASSESSESTSTTNSDSSVAEVVAVPANINFDMTTNIGKVIYDNMEMDNVIGKIAVKESRLSMDHLKMDFMDGKLDLSGGYETKNLDKPAYDFSLDISKWDVQKTATTFNTVEKLAKVMKSAYGKFSANMVIEGLLDSKMEPDMNSIFGKGVLKTHNVKVENENLGKIDKALKTKRYNPLVLNDVDISFEIKDGKITTKPFDIKTGDTKATVYGYTTLEQKMDYTIDTEIPISQFGSAATSAVNNLLGQIKDAGVNTGDLGKSIKVSISIVGDVSNPKIKPNFAGKGKNDGAKQQLKETVKENVEKAKKELKKKAGEEAKKLIADAEKQAAQLEEEAKKQAENVKKEAAKLGDQLRAEAKKQGEDLVDNASNAFAKIAAKEGAKQLEKQADKKAKKLEEEAAKKADAIVAKAKEKGDQLIENAKKKAEEKTK